MRFVIFGAGAIGGVIGGRLHQHGQEVLLIARGAHHEAIRDHGLTVESGDARDTFPLPVFERPAEIDFAPDDVVVLAVKSDATVDALDALRAAAPPTVRVVCAQNGVANERAALRRFAAVYGVCVMCPAAHLEPGVVQAYSTPIAGLLDLGRYPSGVDETARAIAAAFASATFESEPRFDIMRWKYAKLLMNLGNAAEALFERSEEMRELVRRAREEGAACLRAAGIEFVSDEEDRDRRGDRLTVRPINGARRGGGSSWQSLARGTGAIETDYLNGEVVLLGRLHGLATPANELLRELAVEAARAGRPPGQARAEDALARLGPAR
jgi:2-dehydropantoate 2-reductase